MAAERPAAILVPTHQEFESYPALLTGLSRADGADPWEVYEARAGARPVVLIVSGAGPVNCAAAAQYLIDRHAPCAMLHGGSAGAHNPELLPGDVVAGAAYVILTPRSVREAREARGLHPSLIRFHRDGAAVNLDRIEAEPDLLARVVRLAHAETEQLGHWDAPGWPAETPPRPGRVVAGVIGSADSWTVDPAELRALHEDFGAECEDMESAYVAQVCAMHGLPFVAVRVISNSEAARAFMPAEVMPAIGAAGLRAARILAALAADLTP